MIADEPLAIAIAGRAVPVTSTLMSYPACPVWLLTMYICVIAGRITSRSTVRVPDRATNVCIVGAPVVRSRVLPTMLSTSYVAAVKDTSTCLGRPTVKKLPVAKSMITTAESEGNMLRLESPLIVFVAGGVITTDPVPLFRMLTNHPVFAVAVLGSVIVPAPPFHTYVADRLFSVSVTLMDVSITCEPVARRPRMSTSPLPTSVAASAADVPAPNVTFS